MNERRTWKRGLSQEALERAHLRAMSSGRSTAALGYAERLGWSVIPIDLRPKEDPKDEKNPIILWKLYQEEHPTSEEIKENYKSSFGQ